MQIQLPDKIGIVQRSTFDHRARQKYGFQVGHRGDGPCSAHLKTQGLQSGQGLFGLEFIGYRPTGRFGGIAQLLLLTEGIDFDHNTVGGNRQFFSFLVPITNKIEDFVQAAAFAHMFRNAQTPASGLEQILVMSVTGQLFTQHGVKISFELARGYQS